MTRPETPAGRPRFGGVVSRVGAVALAALIAGCSGSSTRTLTTTTTRPMATTSTVADSRLTGLALDAFPQGWVAHPETVAIYDEQLRSRCPRVAAPLAGSLATVHSRVSYQPSDSPIPTVTIDSRDFRSEPDVLRLAPQFASADFVDCLRSVYGAAPLSLGELRVERLVVGAFGADAFGYRVTGTTGSAPQVEHVVAEIVVVPVASSLAVVTFSSTLRFPLDGDAARRIVAALRNLR